MLSWCVSLVAQEPDGASHGDVLLSAAAVSYSVWRGPFDALDPIGLDLIVGRELGGGWSVGAAFRTMRSASATGTAHLNTIAASFRRYDPPRRFLNVVPLRAFFELRPGFVWTTGSHPAVANNGAGAGVGFSVGFQVSVSKAISIESVVGSTAELFSRAIGGATGIHIGVTLRLGGAGERR